MSTKESFATLREFGTTVESCKVSLRGGGELTLEEGLSKAVEMIQSVDRAGKKVILVGNGGSAAIASHQAVDLWKNGGIKATAFNDASLLTCIGNDYGYPDVFAKPIEMFADRGDLVIAISSSGKSVNILNAVDSAQKRGCTTIGFSGFGADNPLFKKADLGFYLNSNSYGIVEVGHLLLIHTAIDQVIQIKKNTKVVELRKRTSHG